MSHVYRAVDTVIGRTVAVKILTEAGCQDSDAKERFLAEARMAGNLAHDNVLGIYDFGEDDQHRPFMVMEFLRGQDLRQAINKAALGDLRARLKIALQVACALGYVHKQKVIHRDIKPDNIHINSAGVVKLMDFGIAKTEGLQMTRAGYVLGTPYYMAPEQVTGENITEQVDVYAFGVLLFELLTGKRPVTGDAVERIFYSILNEPLKMEPLHEAGVPQSVCDLIARCTAKNPADRPQGFDPVCDALEHAIAEPDAPTLEMPTMPRPAPVLPAPAATPIQTPVSRPGWLLPAVLVAIVALGTGLYFALHSPPKAAQTPGKETPGTEAPAPAATLSTPAGEMVLVAAGSFLFGEKKESASLPAYYVDKTEVTNEAYGLFCKETGYRPPPGFASAKPDYPVVNVTISDAMAFAKWAGKRLPAPREWEKAARGSDGRLFPWGNEPDPSRANIGSGALRPATALLQGASPCGALQMAGNVWEWVDQVNTPPAEKLKSFSQMLRPAPTADEPWYTTRGESFQEGKLEDGVLYDVSTVPGRWKNANIGFRCVKSAP
jgi:serine/threonine-protein kinase